MRTDLEVIENQRETITKLAAENIELRQQANSYAQLHDAVKAYNAAKQELLRLLKRE